MIRTIDRPDESSHRTAGKKSPPPLRRAVRGPSSGRRSRRWVGVVIAAAAAAILLGVVLFVQSDYGTVRIEFSAPEAKVDVKFDGQSIELAGLEQPLRLRAGEHGLTVTSPGFETVTKSFALKRGGARKIVVLATKSGLRSDERTLQPAAGESRTLTIRLLPPGETPPSLTNSISTKFVLIPAGDFLMGSVDSDSDADGDEKPRHGVQITKPYYLGVYEVTQGEFRQVMGTNPSSSKGDDTLPVESVSWNDAQAYCKRLSELSAEQTAGRRYRLPTEAEWEYACRAGSTTKYSFGDSTAELGNYAWYDGNAGFKTHPVGQKQPNAWGLYDMHGNAYSLTQGGPPCRVCHA